MAEALQHNRPLDPAHWYKDYKDGQDWRRGPKESQEALEFTSKEKKYTPRPETRFGALLRAAWVIAESEDLAEYARTLADELGVSVEWVYQMALVEFIEGHGGDTKGYANTLRRASPFWQVHEYTTEELDALLEADKFSPEMAERYKDLLED